MIKILEEYVAVISHMISVSLARSTSSLLNEIDSKFLGISSSIYGF